MTRIDIRKRDGLARTGTAGLNGQIVLFPTAIDTAAIFSSLRSMRGNNVPLAADREFVTTYLDQRGDQPIIIHPALDNPAQSGDCVMVANWHTALHNPRSYVDWLVALKGRTPPDTLWYAPACALPSNAHILCYTGFELFDFCAVDLRTAQGVFCAPEGEFPASAMEGGGCTCGGCLDGNLQKHNRTALLCELALIRTFIMQGQLRELVESRSRMHAGHVAIMRHLDSRYPFMELFVPIVRAGVLRANSGESLQRVEIRRFAERVLSRYIPPAADVAVLLPCSAKKPYSLSQSHRKFRRATANRAHELIITSPLGLVPRELETVYPAMHYDVPVTGYWDAEECVVISRILACYFNKHRYRRIIAHLEGGALRVAEQAAEACGISLEYSCREHPGGEAALAKLDAMLSGERGIRDDRLHGICSYQFGMNLDTQGFSLRGHFPELFYSKNNIQCFSIDTIGGLLRPTFDGWNLIPSGYRVTIDDFVPEGDVLVPGVTGVDPQIREGDEVLVVGTQALATGRAAMLAEEMQRSKRGVAVRVRKVKKL